MRCETAQRLLSDQLDESIVAPDRARVEAHLAACASCAAYATQLTTLRRRLRVAALEPPPDVAGEVRARLEDGMRRARPRRAASVARAAAVFVVAFAVGAVTVGLSGPGRVEADDLIRLVRAGQHRLESLQARVTITERGWHPQVRERTHAGELSYRAPETLALRLEDTTPYPTPAWRRNDVTIVVDGATAWSQGRAGCPVTALPDCAPAELRTTVVHGREPFDATDPVPLDLVVPVDSFTQATPASRARSLTVAGRAAVETTVTVAQLRPLLDGVRDVGAWRELHPTDLATVALDAEYGVPLSVRVTANPGDERDRWAAALGHDDDPREVLWSWQLTDLQFNGTIGPPPAPPEDPDVSVDRGFRAGQPEHDPPFDAPPAGMSPHRSGRVGEMVVHSWADGGAWLRVRVHRAWDRDRLFGHDSGQLIRRVVLASSGVAYVAEGGQRVFVHGRDVDVAITGSLGAADLREVADRLQVQGVRVPADWVEASTATLEQATRMLPGLLVSTAGEFSSPGVRVSSNTVTLSYAGNGDRGLVLTQAPGRVLTPPLDDVVLGVTVRGTTGRYTPRTGNLEWVEDDRTVALRSATLSLTELRVLAEQLQAVP